MHPKPSGGFEWAQAPWGAVLRCRPLLEVADHFFTAADLQLRADAMGASSSLLTITHSEALAMAQVLLLGH